MSFSLLKLDVSVSAQRPAHFQALHFFTHILRPFTEESEYTKTLHRGMTRDSLLGQFMVPKELTIDKAN